MKTIMTAITISFMVTGIACAATIQLPQTGQSVCYDAIGTVIACTGTGQDGEKLKGVVWPNPRFTDNGNGTVTDNLTELIWLKNANCFNTQQWAAALTSANTLANGACGLNDGSAVEQWRLPNRKELMSLVDRSKSYPALLADHPFTSLQSYGYWTSSTGKGGTSSARLVNMGTGVDNNNVMISSYYVWPVRGGQ